MSAFQQRGPRQTCGPPWPDYTPPRTRPPCPGARRGPGTDPEPPGPAGSRPSPDHGTRPPRPHAPRPRPTATPPVGGARVPGGGPLPNADHTPGRASRRQAPATPTTPRPIRMAVDGSGTGTPIGTAM